MPEPYVEVQIRADPELEEELAGVLSQLGFEGFWEDGPFLKCYISSRRWDPRLEEEVHRLIALFLHPSHQAFPEITIRTIPIENWNAQWESTIKPIRVSERITITPSWHPYEAGPEEIVLTIDPKMSFGTGYHESTRLMLRLLERFIQPGDRVLDLGTGTGVLAIAAVRLGAASALGVDPDEWSYENAQENVRLNGLEKRVTILCGTIHEIAPARCDIIAANIQRSILESIIPDMLVRLEPRGMLLLSGLLTEDRAPMETALCSAGLAIFDEIGEHEWIALVATRTPPIDSHSS